MVNNKLLLKYYFDEAYRPYRLLVELCVAWTVMSQLRASQNYVWNVTDVLGQGATGSVYKCRHKVPYLYLP